MSHHLSIADHLNLLLFYQFHLPCISNEWFIPMTQVALPWLMHKFSSELISDWDLFVTSFTTLLVPFVSFESCLTGLRVGRTLLFSFHTNSRFTSSTLVFALFWLGLRLICTSPPATNLWFQFLDLLHFCGKTDMKRNRDMDKND